MKKPFAITLDVGSSLANKTGSWRTMRPVYLDRLPPCNHACPAGENIQDQKRVATPAAAVAAGADVLVIGRPVTAAPDPEAALAAILGEVEKAGSRT